MIRRSWIIYSICFLANLCYAQTISVSSFKLLGTDLTANTAGTMELDQNGETAALIKVVTIQTGFTFDGGALGIVKTIQKPSEIWVYVPRGLKKITISHPQLGMLRDYYFNIPIEAARTYEMRLIIGEVKTIIQEGISRQYLVIKVTPADAIVELNNEILQVTDGIAQKFLKFGTYEYRVIAQNYHTAAGKVTIDNPKEKKVLSIDLKPAFGWIEIVDNGDLSSAIVYIDDALIGKVPIKSHSLSSGKHSVKIVHPLYHTFEKDIDVVDNETTLINPSLIPDFSMVTINVGNDADIYVNDEYKGNNIWSGKLRSGSYNIEARKNNHRTKGKQFEIFSSQKEYNIQLEEPDPIFGTINITSIPPMSDVYVDGESYGQTPLFIPDIITGGHDLMVRHKGYNDYNSKITLEENDTLNIEAKLGIYVTASINNNYPDMASYQDYIYVNNSFNKVDNNLDEKYINVYFTSDKEGASVAIDDEIPLTNLSMKPKKVKLSIGTHDFKFSLKGKNNIDKRVEISSSKDTIHVSFKDREIYVR